jgi:hypothetical protein
MFCFECGRVAHGVKGCPVPRPSRLHSATDAKAWGVWLRADDGRRRGFTGSNGTNDEGWKSSQLEGRSAGGADQCWRSSPPGQTRILGEHWRSCSNIPGDTSGESVAAGPGRNGGRKTGEMEDAMGVTKQLLPHGNLREEMDSGVLGEYSRRGHRGGELDIMFSQGCVASGCVDVGEKVGEEVCNGVGGDKSDCSAPDFNSLIFDIFI